MGARSPLAITVPAALAGGALWGLCFAVRPWLPLCLVGLVPLFLLLQQRRAWLFGWLHGIATWVVAVLYWIAVATLQARFTPYDAIRALWAQVPPFTNAVLAAGLGLIATALLIIHVVKRSPRFGDSGRAATLVRGCRAVYLGLFFNCFIMAAVNLAAAKIASIVLGWPMWQTLVICGVLNVAFAASSGLWGVLVVDFIQFGIAMTGAFSAMYFALKQPEVGGMAGLVAKLPESTLSLVPDFSNWPLTLTLFVIPLTLQWWSVWYPGAEPGGGSYIAQRMLAAKSERDALAGTLFFNVAHYALRSWPWIIVALASILVFPTLESIRVAFPNVDPALVGHDMAYPCLLYTSPSPRDRTRSRMPSSA